MNFSLLACKLNFIGISVEINTNRRHRDEARIAA